MPPYLPVLGLSRSQNIRLGRGPGNKLVRQFGTYGTSQLGSAPVPFYADLGDPLVRQDLSHHTTLGAIIAVGPLTNNSSDWDVVTGGTVTPGTGLSVNVAAGTLVQRSTGNRVNFPGATNLATAAPGGAGTDWTYLIVVTDVANGVTSAVAGVAAPTGTSVAPSAPSNSTPLATVVVSNGGAAPGTITDVRPQP